MGKVPKKLLGKVHHQDFLDLAQDLPTSSVDVIVADPPYGRGFHRGSGAASNYRAAEGRNKNPDFRIQGDGDPKRDAWAAQMYRAVKPSGAVYGFCDENTVDAWVVAYKAAGFKVKNVLVWDKRWGFPAGDKYGTYGKRVEFILFCVKGKHKLRRGRHPSLISFARTGDSQPTKGKYPTQKPVELGMFLIEKSCGPKGIVLEPFAGSGFASKAASCLGRSFLGCDVNKKAVKLANQGCASCPVMPEELKLPVKTVAGPYAGKSWVEDLLVEIDAFLAGRGALPVDLREEIWPIGQLVPTEIRRRDPSAIPALATVFEHGWPEEFPPIWVDSKGQIIDGHHRWEGAAAAGLQEVPVLVVDYDLLTLLQEEFDTPRVEAILVLMEHPANRGVEVTVPENIVGHPAPVGPVVVAGPRGGPFSPEGNFEVQPHSSLPKWPPWWDLEGRQFLWLGWFVLNRALPYYEQWATDTGRAEGIQTIRALWDETTRLAQRDPEADLIRVLTRMRYLPRSSDSVGDLVPSWIRGAWEKLLTYYAWVPDSIDRELWQIVYGKTEGPKILDTVIRDAGLGVAVYNDPQMDNVEEQLSGFMREVWEDFVSNWPDTRDTEAAPTAVPYWEAM